MNYSCGGLAPPSMIERAVLLAPAGSGGHGFKIEDMYIPGIVAPKTAQLCELVKNIVNLHVYT
jgi:hypothetical protein